VSRSLDNVIIQTAATALWPARLCAVVRLEIYPHRVIVSRFGLNGSALKARRVVACQPPATDAPAWAGAVAALGPILALPEFRHARAEVILSNHFMRYAVVPWRGDLAGDAERLAFVRHCLAKIYGARTESWALRLSEARYGAPAVAAAMDLALLEAVRAAARAAALWLISVESFFSVAFNRSRAQIADDSFWFVTAEKERACVARVEGGDWRSLCCQRMGEDWTRELPWLLARERLLGGAPEARARVYLYAPGLTGTELLAGEWTHDGLKLPLGAGIAKLPELVSAVATEEIA
jgi:hypothetical protein